MYRENNEISLLGTSYDSDIYPEELSLIEDILDEMAEERGITFNINYECLKSSYKDYFMANCCITINGGIIFNDVVTESDEEVCSKIIGDGLTKLIFRFGVKGMFDCISN